MLVVAVSLVIWRFQRWRCELELAVFLVAFYGDPEYRQVALLILEGTR